jgi:PAS domain-containing protein
MEWNGAREVMLSWPRPDDPRIAGFRVWRAPVPTAGAEPAWYPVGSTYSESFVDLTGDDGTPSWYRLTAFTARGSESAPGGIAIAARDISAVDALFGNGFEGPPGVIVVPPN